MAPRLTALPLAAGLALLATGCGASGEDDATTKGTVTQVSVRPGTAKGFVGARADVTGLTCARSGSSWRVSGKVTNPTAAKANYRIYTSFVTQDSRTVGLLETDVSLLAAGSSQSWSGRSAIKGTGLRCILRVERTRA